LISSINTKLQKEIVIPNTNSSISINVQDQILVDSQHLDLKLKFKFDHKKRMLARAGNDLSNITDDSNEFKIFANHDLVNSLIKAIYLANDFRINITSDIVKPEIPFKMNTKFFQYVIPGIYDKYPDQELVLQAILEKEPQIFFDKTNQTIQLSSNGAFNFALRNDQTRSILSLKSLFYLELKLGADQDAKVHFLLKNISINELAIIQSEFPGLNQDFLQKNLNYLFTVVCNAANEFYLGKGIQIPVVYGLKFKKVALVVEDNFLSIALQPDLNITRINWLKLF